MRDSIFGQMKFYTYVSVSSDTTRAPRRVTLASVYCDYAERHEVIERFKSANTGFKEIFARFVYEEHI